MVSQRKNIPGAGSHDRRASDKPAVQQTAGSRDRRPSDKVAAQRKFTVLQHKKG